MISATGYSANARDILFVLFEQLGIERDVLAIERFADFDREMVEQMLEQLETVGREQLNPLWASGDRQECRYDGATREVHTPDGWPELYQAYASAGWPAMAGDPEFGGMGLPYVVSNTLNEIPMAANCGLYLYALLVTGAGNLLERFGSEEMKTLFLPRMYSGEFAATMLLTEPGAGSDVGASRTTARKKAGEDFYRLKGDKLFITGGEQDLTHNIVHLVLARVEGAPAGTRGLSLFLVPKFRRGDDGEFNVRNDIYCTGIEHKMGIRGSATCALSLGDDDDCRGWLIGEENKGMRLMFHMMNEARMDTGMQGVCLGSAAYFNALAYARERVQGSPGGTIIDHPDVRRMLLRMKAQVEGGRALMARAAWHATLAEHGPESERARHGAIFALMTPVCKGWGSERGFEICSTGMQVLGGYGYCQEYPLEQLTRDVRIASIYEGTTGIQALDLVGRKVMGDGGKGLTLLLAELDAGAEEWRESAAVAPLLPVWQAARGQLEQAAQRLIALGRDGFAKAALDAVPFLFGMGDLLVAWELMDQARIAEQALAAGSLAEKEQLFYRGKLTAASFFVRRFLPAAGAALDGLAAGDSSALDHVFGEE